METGLCLQNDENSDAQAKITRKEKNNRIHLVVSSSLPF
jgi:hypothetical protein